MADSGPTPLPVHELLKKGEDFEFFCEQILGVRLNKAQKRIARIMRMDPNHDWPFKELVVVAANQIGKTLIQSCIMLWACLYKVGVDPADMKQWDRSPYLWIHLGPVQQQAYHAQKDLKMLIKGEHSAQDGRSKLPKGLINEAKIENYYDGFQLFNGSTIMFRTAEHKAEAVLGYRAAGISVDEAAFVDYLTEVKDTVLMLRLIASGGPIMMFSTPNGMNDFYEQHLVIRESGEEIEDMVWHHDSSWLVFAHITDNLGYGLDQSEIDRMEEKLNPATKEQQLRGAFLEPAEAFFIPQDEILEAFRGDLPAFQEPIPGHQYAIMFDPSISSDPTAAIVLDCTEWPWIGVYMGHWLKPGGVDWLIGEMMKTMSMYHGHADANVLSVPTRAVLGYDATSMGGAAFTSMLSRVNPKRPINMAGAPAKKIEALSNLRARLTNGQIILPHAWAPVRSEVLNYRLDDKKIRQDLVMALMGADMVATTMIGSMQKPVPVNPHARTSRRKVLTWR